MRALAVVWLAAASSCSGAQRPPAPAACPAAPVVVFVETVAPRTGEKIEYDETAAFDFTFGDTGGLSGRSHFATVETVADVDRGLVTAAEVQFVAGVASTDVTGPMQAQPPQADLTGKTYRISYDGKEEYRGTDGAAVSDPEERALARYSRNDVGQPYWATHLVAHQTFIQGVETHLTVEAARAMNQPADVRLTLTAVEAGRARFAVTMVQGAPLPLEYAGEFIVDLGLGRVTEVRMKGSSPTMGGITLEQKFRYELAGQATAAAAEPAAGCPDAPETLHVPWQDHRVGERLAFHQEMSVDTTVHRDRAARPSRLRSAWQVDTEEQVTAVANGLITGLEVAIPAGTYQPLAIDAEPPAPESMTGKGFTVALEGSDRVVTRGGLKVDGDTDHAVGTTARNDVGRRFWLTRVLTDRSYQVGREARFTEPVDAIAAEPAELGVTLVSIEGGVATFELDLRIAWDVGGPGRVPMFFRGKATLDVATARPRSLRLEASYDVKGVTSDGHFTLDQTYAYRAPP